MKIPFDLHTHCDLSYDGESTAEEMLEKACELGMEYLALTDHIDINVFDDPDYRCDRTEEQAKKLIPPLKEKYRDRIKLLFGAEIGQAVHNSRLAGKIISENSYDFILASCHFIRGYDDFYFLDYTKPGNEPYKLLKIYFDEVMETAETADFDSLAHLTYPFRYIAGKYGISIDTGRFSAVTDKIFETLIKRGKALEINTAGLRQEIRALLPEQSFIDRYRSLGGRLITIGSDAHKTSDLGKNIFDGINAAKSAGFTETAVFIKREPKFIKI